MKDLVVAETYKDKDGNEKTSWSKVGVLIEREGKSGFVKLNMFPNLLINVFDQKPKVPKPEVEEIQDKGLPF